MSTSRRDFLKHLSLAAAASIFGVAGLPRRALAASSIDPRHRFVFVHFDGAWDITMSLDPRDPALGYETGKDGIQLAWSRIGAFGNPGLLHDAGPIAYGPVMTEMMRHRDVSCVVRGMTMGTLTHEVGRRYFLTGKSPAGLAARGSSTGAVISEQLAGAAPTGLCPVPNLVVDSEAFYTGSVATARPFRVGAANTFDLVVAFMETSLQIIPDTVLSLVKSPATGVTPLESYRQRAQHCDPTGLDRSGQLSMIRSAQSRARDMIAANLAGHFMFEQSTPEMDGLNQRYGSRTFGTPGMTAAIAYQALKYDIANCITLRLQHNLDTHSSLWSTEQPRLLRDGFGALATLVDDLKTPDPITGERMIDRTTIVVFSEFSRTPLLNASGGRDHSLTNACLLMGAGVPHNRVIGASGAIGMPPQRVDPATGEVSASGVDLRPQDIWAAVLASNGYDTTAVQTVPMPCLTV